MTTEQPGNQETGAATALYSPVQLAVGAFLGGPLAAVYFLWENYAALNAPDRAKAALAWGGAICVVLIFAVLYLPAQFPQFLIPMMTAVVAYQLATRTMPSKVGIATDSSLQFQSNWRVFLLSIVAVIIFVVLSLAVTYVLLSVGALNY